MIILVCHSTSYIFFHCRTDRDHSGRAFYLMTAGTDSR